MTKKNTHKRKMVVTFVSGNNGIYTLKGEFEDMNENVVSYLGDAIRDNEPFYIIESSTIINPSNVTAVTFGPVEEYDGA